MVSEKVMIVENMKLFINEWSIQSAYRNDLKRSTTMIISIILTMTMNSIPVISDIYKELIIRTEDGDGLHEYRIGVIVGHRRGYSIDYIVLIMNRAMKRD